MMIITFLLFIIPLINLTTSQIPNPRRYRLTRESGHRYAVDKITSKMSSKVYSIGQDPSSVSNTQTIYVPSEGRTYYFALNTIPPCSVDRAFTANIDVWAGIVDQYGGENKTYDKIIFDEDCGGPCLTWFIQRNDTYTSVIYQGRLYIRQNDSTPIKVTTADYSIRTGELLKTGGSKFTFWDLGEIPDSEFEFPIDTERCYHTKC